MASKRSTVITSAADAASVDSRSRTLRYLVLQGLRVMCIMAAFLIPGWPKWVVIAAAAILPGIAVLMANQPNQRKLLEAEAREAEQAAAAALTDGSYRTVPGELVDEDGDPADQDAGPAADPPSPDTQHTDTQHTDTQHTDNRHTERDARSHHRVA